MPEQTLGGDSPFGLEIVVKGELSHTGHTVMQKFLLVRGGGWGGGWGRIHYTGVVICCHGSHS